MKDTLTTIALLPYSKAEVLRSLIEAEGLECSLENMDMIEGTIASGVRVRIREKDIKQVFPLLEQVMEEPWVTRRKTEDTVLVPVDFSSFSFSAAHAAHRIARKLGSRLILYHIIAQPDFYALPYTDFIGYDAGITVQIEQLEKDANTRFGEFVSKLILAVGGEEQWNSVENELMIQMGNPEVDMLAYTEKHPPRVIIMGIKGQHAVSENLMGTTTAEITSRAKVPVLAIPEDMHPLDFDAPIKVVYATNFDEKDFVAVDKLFGLLKPFHTKVYCVHVGTGENRDWNEAKLEAMKTALAKKYQQELECVYLQGRDILEQIESYISENQIDILSLTTHRRNLITRMFNPSIAREMLFHTRTPLLVFHA